MLAPRYRGDFPPVRIQVDDFKRIVRDILSTDSDIKPTEDNKFIESFQIENMKELLRNIAYKKNQPRKYSEKDTDYLGQAILFIILYYYNDSNNIHEKILEKCTMAHTRKLVLDTKFGNVLTLDEASNRKEMINGQFNNIAACIKANPIKTMVIRSRLESEEECRDNHYYRIQYICVNIMAFI